MRRPGPQRLLRLADVNVLHLFLDVVLGATFGFVGGLFGIGGGIVAIPILGLAFHMSEQLAQGTALVMVVPNVAIGLWSYYKRRSVNVRYALTLAISALPFTYVGARIATNVPSASLRLAFAIFTLVIASYMLWKSFPKDVTRRPAAPWFLASIVGAIGGIVSGFFSVGGATFAVPAMAAYFDLAQTAAQPMGLALVSPGTVVGLATYGAASDVDWTTGFALAIGSVPTVGFGVALAHKLPDRTLKMLFSLFLFASAGALFSHL